MVDFHPKAQMKPISLREIIPDALASRSMKINPWVSAQRSCVTLTKTSSDFQLKTRSGIRNLTIEEATRLSSFPDAFQWTDARHGRERIGNSVPPRFMSAIAQHICAELLHRGFIEGQKSMPLDFIDKPINPDTPRLFNVISTFAGAGGSSLGYKWAGGKVLAAVEWDENAVATYRLNFPDTPVLHRDIATVTTEELLALAGLQVGELDIFDGSPPCQSFSTAGKRQIDDPRTMLFNEYVRLLRGLQPKVFVMENVSGMVKGHMKHVFAIVMRELKASGYQVKCQLMNAMYFGVPQSRERVIFIGVRNDLGIEASHPMAQTKPTPFTAYKEPGDAHVLTTLEWQKVRAHRAHHEAKGNGFGYTLHSDGKPSFSSPILQRILTRF